MDNEHRCCDMGMCHIKLAEPKPKPTEGFFAEWKNQYGRTLGDGIGLTREDAVAKAAAAADRELLHANPNWKWRKAKLSVKPWTLRPGDLE